MGVCRSAVSLSAQRETAAIVASVPAYKQTNSINGVLSSTFRGTCTFLIHREPHKQQLLLNLRLARTRLSDFFDWGGLKEGRFSKDGYLERELGVHSKTGFIDVLAHPINTILNTSMDTLLSKTKQHIFFSPFIKEKKRVFW